MTTVNWRRIGRAVALRDLAKSGLAVVLGLGLSALLLAATGTNVPNAASAMLQGSVGSPLAITQTLVQAIPITVVGLGVAFAFRGGLFNIGGDGQLYIGALCAVQIGLWLANFPPIARLTFLLAAGAVGGALWGGAAGWMRSRLRMNEVITTLLMNYIGFWFVSYLVHGPLMDPTGGGYPWTRALGAGATIGDVSIGTFAIPVGFLFTLGIAVSLAFVLRYTQFGIDTRTLGDNPSAAEFSGVRTSMRLIQIMLVSGAVAGLGGALDLAGNQYRLSDFFSPGYGYTAIAVALVGNASPVGTVLAGLFFGALTAGAGAMERIAGVPAPVTGVIQGLIIFTLVCARSAIVWSSISRLAGPVRSRVLETTRSA